METMLALPVNLDLSSSMILLKDSDNPGANTPSATAARSPKITLNRIARLNYVQLLNQTNFLGCQ